MKRILSAAVSLSMLLPALSACGPQETAAPLQYGVYAQTATVQLPVDTVLSAKALDNTIWALGETEDGLYLLTWEDSEDVQSIPLEIEPNALLAPASDSVWIYSNGEIFSCQRDGSLHTAFTLEDVANLTDLAVTADNSILAATEGQVQAYSENGVELWSLEAPDGYPIGKLHPLADDTVLCQPVWSPQGIPSEVYILDTQAPAFRAASALVSDGFALNVNLTQSGGSLGYDCLMAAPLGGAAGAATLENACMTYGIDLDTGEKTPLFDTAGLNQAGEILLIYAQDGEASLLLADGRIMSLAPTGREKEILTIARVGEYAGSVTAAINAFNHQSQDYYLSAVLYDTELDFHLDLVQGFIPDVVSLTGVTYEILARDGFFVNLYTLMDEDSFSRADFFPAVLSALEWSNGELYQITPEFSLSAVAATAETIEAVGTWELPSVAAYSDANPDMQIIGGMTAWDTMNLILDSELSHFIDYDAMEAHFDSEDFYLLLELLQRQQPNMMAGNAAILSAQKFSSLRSYKEQMTILQGQGWGDVVVTGYPGYAGSGTYIDTAARFGLCALSENQTGAWAFLKSILSETYQRNVTEFPIRISALDAMVAEAANGFPAVEGQAGTHPVIGQELEGCTDAEIELLYSLIDAVRRINTDPDNTLLSIIYEEVLPFLNGNKTQEEVAALLNSRINLYLAEQA